MLIDTPGLPPMTGGSGAASAKQVSNAGSQFGNAWAETVRVVDNNNGNGSEAAQLAFNKESRYARITTATCTRCNAWRGELGSEKTHDCAGWATGVKCGQCFICHLVEVFAAVKRVLRPDGVCLVNLGDSYAGSGKGPTGYNGIGDQERRQGFSTSKGARIGSQHGESGHTSGVTPPPGLKAKDLVGIPWRFALAMQAAGWWLRGDYIWSKPNPMPESVTDRCTRAHEYIFHFSKSATYHWDADAIREPQQSLGERHNGRSGYREGHPTEHGINHRELHPIGRNKRSVWEVATHAYPEAHFATFPPDLVKPCILAGTSERGACAQCGAPHRRITKPTAEYQAVLEAGRQTEAWKGERRAEAINIGVAFGDKAVSTTRSVETTGWAPTCQCGTDETRPCVVLDPFNGSGTSMVVARALGRYAVGVELQPSYVEMAIKRLRQGVLL